MKYVVNYLTECHQRAHIFLNWLSHYESYPGYCVNLTQNCTSSRMILLHCSPFMSEALSVTIDTVFITMANPKVTLLLIHWSYVSFALSHQYGLHRCLVDLVWSEPNGVSLWPIPCCWNDMLATDASGARLTKAYDVTIQRYRNSHAKIHDSTMHILWCMGSKFCVKFQRCPLKFHTKFWTHTLQNMHFMRW